MKLAEYHRQALAGLKPNSSVSLHRRKGRWWLTLSVDAPLPDLQAQPRGATGADVGIVNYLSDSAGQRYGGVEDDFEEYISMLSVTILTFNIQWNNFFGPLIFINSPNNMTLPLGLTFLSGQNSATSSGIIMAGVTLALLPVLIMFVIFQKQLIQRISFTGLTGD